MGSVKGAERSCLRLLEQMMFNLAVSKVHLVGLLASFST